VRYKIISLTLFKRLDIMSKFRYGYNYHFKYGYNNLNRVENCKKNHPNLTIRQIAKRLKIPRTEVKSYFEMLGLE